MCIYQCRLNCPQGFVETQKFIYLYALNRWSVKKRM